MLNAVNWSPEGYLKFYTITFTDGTEVTYDVTAWDDEGNKKDYKTYIDDLESIYVDNKDQKTHNLKAEVDPPYEGHPNGDIIEENESNNIFEVTIRAKTRNFNFLILLTHFPSFQRLLNL